MDEQAMLRNAMEESNKQLDEYSKSQSKQAAEDLPEVSEVEDNKELEKTSEEINKALEPQEEVKENENWRKAREARRRLELENEELKRQLDSRINSQPVQQVSQPTEDDYEIEDFLSTTEDDALITAKEAKRLIEHNKKILKSIKAIKQEYRQESAETRLRVQFPDYWEVVTPDNLKLLAQKMPGTSEIVRTQQDPYLQHVAAYEAIKNLNSTLKKEEEYLPNKVKIANNSVKPKGISSMPSSNKENAMSALTSNFMPLSPEEKARWRKMADDAIAGL